VPRAKIVVQIVDDTREHPTAAQIRSILDRENGYQVKLTANRYSEQPSDSDNRPDLIIAVLPASWEKSRQILAMIRAKEPSTLLLAVVNKDGLNEMLDELSRWNMDFLVTPLRSAEVRSRVKQLLSRNQLSEQTAQSVALARLVGADPVVVALKQKLPLVARHGAPVLLTGETGTGKELCARALHYLSARSARAFFPVNCGAIPVELFESELFGHRRGAFTGASDTQVGLIEEADGGTLFLDEIDSLNPAVQVKLLRFIENHTYHSLGSARERHADV
jgi:DNA-binding NtrC family response regulator